MNLGAYYRLLVGQAWNDSLAVMQWRTTPLYTFLFAGIIFGVTLVFFKFATSRSEARNQLLWYVLSGAVTVAAFCAISSSLPSGFVRGCVSWAGRRDGISPWSSGSLGAGTSAIGSWPENSSG